MRGKRIRECLAAWWGVICITATGKRSRPHRELPPLSIDVGRDLPPTALPSDLDSDASAHRLVGRMTNGVAWHAGGRDIVSFCSCGRAFYGLDITAADARLTAHQRRERG